MIADGKVVQEEREIAELENGTVFFHVHTKDVREIIMSEARSKVMNAEWTASHDGRETIVS